MASYKVGDIVLVKSSAGDCIPNVHVKLLKRIVTKPTKGKQIGIRRTMDWPGYSGWEAEMVYQDEIDDLRKNWSIPFEKPGDSTFVYDCNIVKKPRKRRSIDSRKVNRSGKNVSIRRKK
jgi:hypothetical protein